MRTVLIGALIALIIGPMSGQGVAETSRIRTGTTLPNVTAIGLKNERITIPTGTRGNVTVLHFWAVGCSSCREEMPALDHLYRTHVRRGLSILAINVGQPKKMVQEGVRGLGVSYPILLDEDRRIASAYEVVGVPRTIILDRRGIVRFKIVGTITPQTIKRFIETLL